MNKIEMSKNPDYCFAALKLIEQLYKDGKIPNFMYRNILNIPDLRAFLHHECTALKPDRTCRTG